MKNMFKKLMMLCVVTVSIIGNTSAREGNTEYCYIDESFCMDDSYYEPIDRNITLSIRNKGWYFAHASLSYYIPEKKEMITQSFNNFPILQTKKFHIPQGVLYVHLAVYYKNVLITGLEADYPIIIFSTSITNEVADLMGSPNTIVYDIWGTTFKPQWRLTK